MIITLIYRGIVALMLCLVVWNMFRQENWREQVGSILVIIPLLLRVLMIK